MAETLADLLREVGIDYRSAAVRGAEQAPGPAPLAARDRWMDVQVRATPRVRQGDYARERQYRVEGARDQFMHGRTLGDRVGAAGTLAANALPVVSAFPMARNAARAGQAGDYVSAGFEGGQAALEVALAGLPSRGPALLGRMSRAAPAALPRAAAPASTGNMLDNEMRALHDDIVRADGQGRGSPYDDWIGLRGEALDEGPTRHEMLPELIRRQRTFDGTYMGGARDNSMGMNELLDAGRDPRTASVLPMVLDDYLGSFKVGGHSERAPLLGSPDVLADPATQLRGAAMRPRPPMRSQGVNEDRRWPMFGTPPTEAPRPIVRRTGQGFAPRAELDWLRSPDGRQELIRNPTPEDLLFLTRENLGNELKFVRDTDGNIYAFSSKDAHHNNAMRALREHGVEVMSLGEGAEITNRDAAGFIYREPDGRFVHADDGGDTGPWEDFVARVQPRPIPLAIRPQTRASDGSILPRAEPRPFSRTAGTSTDLREAARSGGQPETLYHSTTSPGPFQRLVPGDGAMGPGVYFEDATALRKTGGAYAAFPASDGVAPTVYPMRAPQGRIADIDRPTPGEIADARRSGAVGVRNTENGHVVIFPEHSSQMRFATEPPRPQHDPMQGGTPEARERLRAQGFTTDAYRGLADPYDPTFPNADYGKAQFFSSSPEVASTYADDMGFGGGNVLPAQLRMQNPLTVQPRGARHYGAVALDDLPSDVRAHAERDGSWYQPYGQGGPRIVAAEDVARHAQKLGYDGVTMRGMVDDMAETGLLADSGKLPPADIHVVFDPRNIRSRFARGLDSDSSDLLASVAAPLAGAALLNRKRRK